LVDETLTLPVNDLIFVVEAGTNTTMTTRFGRAPRGQWAYGVVPCNHEPNTTLLAGLTHAGMGPSTLVSVFV
jgi:hypothetical protein